MKEVELYGLVPVFQGDVMFTLLQKLPDDAKPADDNVIAHSETGHHHIAKGGACFRSASPATSYIVTGGSLDIEHLRPFDTHEMLRIKNASGSVIQVRRQRQWTPEGYRLVAD